MADRDRLILEREVLLSQIVTQEGESSYNVVKFVEKLVDDLVVDTLNVIRLLVDK